MKCWSLGKQKNDDDHEKVEIPRRVLAAEKNRRSCCACTLMYLSLFSFRAGAPAFSFAVEIFEFFITQKEIFRPRRSKKSLTHLHEITRSNDTQIARNFTTRRRRIYVARVQNFGRFYHSKKEIRSENARCSSQKSVFSSRGSRIYTSRYFFFPLSLSLSIPTQGKPPLCRAYYYCLYTHAHR